METVAERLDADAALRELAAAPAQSLPISFGDLADETVGADTAVADFSACYTRELSSLTWFVMSLGADAHRAADVARSAFAEAFAVWDRIQHPTAWLRRVAGRLYYRYLVTEDLPGLRNARGCGTFASARAVFVGYTSNAHRQVESRSYHRARGPHHRPDP